MITFLILLLIILFHYKSNYYAPRWAMSSFVVVTFLTYQITLQSSFYFGLLYWWLAVNAGFWAIYNFTTRYNHFADLENCRTFISVLLMGIVFYFLDREIIDSIFYAAPFLLIFNSLFKMIPYRFRRVSFNEKRPDPEKNLIYLVPVSKPIYGIGGNPSVDSTFVSLLIGITLPLEIHFLLKSVAILAALHCLIDNKASAGALGFIFALLVWLFLIGEWYALTALTVLTVLLLVIIRKDFFRPSGRIEMWNHVSKKLIMKNFAWQGLGNGSYKVFAPMAGEVETNYDDGHGNKINMTSLWAHNDCLQFFIENGVVGTILVLGFIFSIMPIMDLAAWVFFAALIPNLIFNFPMHLAPDTLLVVASLKNLFLDK
jgi:hypothetical protein